MSQNQHQEEKLETFFGLREENEKKNKLVGKKEREIERNNYGSKKERKNNGREKERRCLKNIETKNRVPTHIA